MDYLDTAFDFSELVYEWKATFAILGVSNDDYAAMHTLLKNANGELRFHISLFNTQNAKSENSPEFVLFHELDVGLYASIVNRSNTMFVAKEAVQQLKPMFPSIERLYPVAQISVIADIMVGLMRGSLFEAEMAWPFVDGLDSEDKDFFHEFALQLLRYLRIASSSAV